MNKEELLRSWLIEELNQSGLTQVELEKEIGVEQYTISRFLKGSSPRGNNMISLYEYMQRRTGRLRIEPVDNSILTNATP